MRLVVGSRISPEMGERVAAVLDREGNELALYYIDDKSLEIWSTGTTSADIKPITNLVASKYGNEFTIHLSS